MIDLEAIREIYLFPNNIDMRMGINKIRTILSLTFSPIEILDCLFIFVSKSKRYIKIYYENDYGNWLFINKLKYFKVQIPSLEDSTTITKRDIELLLTGCEMRESVKKEYGI